MCACVNRLCIHVHACQHVSVYICVCCLCDCIFQRVRLSERSVPATVAASGYVQRKQASIISPACLVGRKCAAINWSEFSWTWMLSTVTLSWIVCHWAQSHCLIFWHSEHCDIVSDYLTLSTVTLSDFLTLWPSTVTLCLIFWHSEHCNIVFDFLTVWALWHCLWLTDTEHCHIVLDFLTLTLSTVTLCLIFWHSEHIGTVFDFLTL